MAKKKKKQEAVEGEELQDGKKKKKGKKKLLFLLLILVVVAAAAAAVIFLDIGGLGSKLGLKKSAEEKEPSESVEAYMMGEDTAASLDTVLEGEEGIRLAAQTLERSPKTETSAGSEEGDGSEGDGSKGDSSKEDSSADAEKFEERIYVYDVPAPAAVVNKYLDAITTGDEAFSLLDEDSLVTDERPELEDALGVVTLARASVQEGHLFQMVIGWSEASSLTVRLTVPEGALQYPEPKDPLDLATLAEQMDQLKAMDPKELGLSGASMDDYEIYVGEGFVTVDGNPCRRFSLYERRPSGEGHYPDIAGIYLFSTDKKHIYVLDGESNTVMQLR